MVMSEADSELTDMSAYGATERSEVRQRKQRRPKTVWGLCLILASAFAVFLFVVVVIVSFDTNVHGKWTPPPEVTTSVGKWIDKHENPCTDFFRFTCGHFLDSTKLQPGQHEKTLTWDSVDSRMRARLKALLSRDDGEGGRFYSACMNENEISALAGVPLEPFLTEVSEFRQADQLVRVTATLHAAGVPVLFDWETVVDPDKPTQYVMTLMPGGLTLQSPHAYLDESDSGKRHLKRYKSIIASTLGLTGFTLEEADKMAEDVLHIEKSLAKLWSPPRPAGGVPLPPRRIKLSMVVEQIPRFDMARFFQILSGKQEMPPSNDNNFIVMDAIYFSKLSDFIRSVGTRAFRSYFRFRMAIELGKLLNNDFTRQGLALARVFNPEEKEAPRWHKCLDITIRNLPDVVGKLYTDAFVPEEAEVVARSMLRRIRDAYRESISSANWLHPSTRKQAVDKLDNMAFEVAAPRHWRKPGFSIHGHEFAKNVLHARHKRVQEDVHRLWSKVDRRAWGAVPVTEVNLVYSREVNTLFVPAGIMQSPFFDPHGGDAANFGALGALCAHEMTRAFDSGGQVYDSYGHLRPWFPEDDIARFQVKTNCVKTLYSNYIEPEGRVNGALTLDQNVADLSGLDLAWAALHHKGQPEDLGVKKSNKERPGVEVEHGAEELFFIAYGQLWCGVDSSSNIALKLRHDVHAPYKYRVNGVVSQLEAFSETFDCPAGTKMNSFPKCRVW